MTGFLCSMSCSSECAFYRQVLYLYLYSTHQYKLVGIYVIYFMGEPGGYVEIGVLTVRNYVAQWEAIKSHNRKLREIQAKG